MRHPRERRGRDLSRREFLKRSAGAAVAVPSLAAILDACTKPGTTSSTSASSLSGTGGIHVPGSPYPLARQDAPVTWKIFDDNPPIKSDLQPEKGATLQIYNWTQYIWKKVIQEFCDQYHCDYKITTFNNMDEALAKMQTGQLKFDVFFPTFDVLGKLVTAKLLQPINKDYIPNLAANVWDVYENPWYDQKANYTVPYTVYVTGIEYHRDVISDEQVRAMDNPYDLLYDPKYKGRVGVYDDYREAMVMTLMRRGITDVNTTDPKLIQQMGDDLVELTQKVDVRTSINDAYLGLPHDQYDVVQAWSGDCAAAWFYVPKYTMDEFERIGFWYPEDRKGVVSSDCIAIPQNAEHPVLSHLFLNFMLDKKHSLDNFAWVGYQVPQNAADPAELTTTKSIEGEPYVFPWLSDAVVRKEDFSTGYTYAELAPDVDAEWHDAWSRFKSG
jgi:spermidine/putrescine transport system substrate-binding protein